MTDARRVVVTGVGVLSPLGASAIESFQNAVGGRSAIRRLDAPWAARLEEPVGAPTACEPREAGPPSRLRMMDRSVRLGLDAVLQALTDARFDPTGADPARCGAFVGTALGGAGTTDEGYEAVYGQRSDRVRPHSVLAAMNHALAAWIGIDHAFAGPNLTFSTACSSAAVAIGEAARRIRGGDADVMLAGGAEAPLVFGVMRAWEALRAVARMDALDPSRSCRPFARDRSGLVLGEGAAFVLLEELGHARARGAPLRVELAGYGLANDRVHITRPSAEGQAAAMRAALADAGLEAREIGYVNAHGTATTQNDPVETEAIKRVFGADARRLPVSSTKAVHGHLLGAGGALEFVLSILALEQGVIPPTMHLEEPDPACDLDYVPGRARDGVSIEAVMSNAFAFGGSNATLIARRLVARRS